MDANRDISNLVDPAVQEFIYRRGLYLREPQDKPLLRTEDLDFTDYPPAGCVHGGHAGGICPAPWWRSCGSAATVSCCCATGCRGRCWEPSATGSWSPVSCMTGWGSLELSGYVRQKAGVGQRSSVDCGCRTATSAGAGAAAADGGVYHGTGAGVSLRPVRSAAGAEHSYVLNLLRRQGFVPAPVPGRPVLEVDMPLPHRAEPQRGHFSIKAPLASMPRVTAAVAVAHRRLQEALTEPQPGSLVLSLSAGDHLSPAAPAHHRTQRRTRRTGDAPAAGTGYLRPPYGKLLRGVAVP